MPFPHIPRRFVSGKTRSGRYYVASSQAVRVSALRRKNAAKKLQRFARKTARPKLMNVRNRMNNNEFLAVKAFNEAAPNPIQLGAKAYYWGGVLGNSNPANWSAGFQPLQGTQIDKGNAAGDRQGVDVYLNKTVINIQIDTNASGTSNTQHPTMDYRLIVFKSKFQYLSGGTSDPSNKLFLNSVNQPFGHATADITGFDLCTQPVNRRQFIVLRDNKFTLSRPAVAMAGSTNAFTSGWSSKYPCSKKLTLTLPHRKKVRYDESTDQPVNYNPAWSFILYSRSHGMDNAASAWEISIRGTTVYNNL